MKKQKETIIYDSKGPSGNIFFILNAVRKVLQKQQRITEYNDLREKVKSSESYDQAIAHINEYVNLKDIQNDDSEIEME